MSYNTTPTIGINFSDVGSNPTQVTGVLIDGTDDQTWQYVYAGSALTNGSAVHIGLSNTAQPLTPALAVTAGDIGFSQATMAAGQHGWVARKGRNLNIMTLTGCAASVALWTTDTAGVLDDAVNTLSQYQVMGTILYNSNSAGATTAVLGAAQAMPIIRRGASGV